MDYVNTTLVLPGNARVLIATVGPGGILLLNQSTAALWLGGPTVTADQSLTGGLLMSGNRSLFIPGRPDGERAALYGISSSGTTVSWLQPQP